MTVGEREENEVGADDGRRMITRSTRVRASDFEQPWFRARARELGVLGSIPLHRKIWEHVVIAQTFLHLKSQPKWVSVSRLCSLGFGVGREPIPAWLAAHYSLVLATDQPSHQAGDWIPSHQHSSTIADLPSDDALISRPEFLRRVVFEPVDMRQISSHLLEGGYHFTWSAGSFEHIGSISAGLDFFCQQMRCLRPGGIACHTTEFNVTSNERTIEAHNLVLFRQRDLEELRDRLARQGDRLWELDLAAGPTEADRCVHNPDELPHLNLRIGEHITTSVVLIAERGEH